MAAESSPNTTLYTQEVLDDLKQTGNEGYEDTRRWDDDLDLFSGIRDSPPPPPARQEYARGTRWSSDKSPPKKRRRSPTPESQSPPGPATASIGSLLPLPRSEPRDEALDRNLDSLRDLQVLILRELVEVTRVISDTEKQEQRHHSYYSYCKKCRTAAPNKA